MATAALDRKVRSRRFAAVASVVSAAVVAGIHRLVKPKSASVANLRAIPLTVAGLACIDTGVFIASTVAGWIVTGLTLIVLEYMISDES